MSGVTTEAFDIQYDICYHIIVLDTGALLKIGGRRMNARGLSTVEQFRNHVVGTLANIIGRLYDPLAPIAPLTLRGVGGRRWVTIEGCTDRRGRRGIAVRSNALSFLATTLGELRRWESEDRLAPVEFTPDYLPPRTWRNLRRHPMLYIWDASLQIE